METPDPPPRGGAPEGVPQIIIGDPECSQALKRVALSMLRDDSAADDLVQDVWLAAIEQPPELHSDGRAWLAAIARNIGRQELRSRSRRLERERRAARPELTTLAQAAEDRGSLQQTLGTAIDELEPLYASTLRARFFEELSAREIAEREGCGEGAIRSRIRRGLRKLRARLEPEFGGAHGFALALVGGFEWNLRDIALVNGHDVAGHVGAGAQAGGLSSALTKTMGWTGALVASCLLAFLGLKGLRQSTLAPEAHTAEAPLQQPPRLSAGEEPIDLNAAASTPTRTAVGVEGTKEPLRVPPRPESGTIEVAVVDASGVSIAGARVYIVKEQLAQLAGTTDLDGRALVPWNVAGLESVTLPSAFWRDREVLTVIAFKEGYGASSQVSMDPRVPQEFALACKLSPEGHTLRGRVIAPDGRGVEGARVCVAQEEQTWVPSSSLSEARLAQPVDVISGRDGEFLIEGLSPRPALLTCRVEGIGGGAARVAGSKDELIEVDILLHEGVTVGGRVTDEAGEPLAQVTVTMQHRFDMRAVCPSTTTDAEGRYEFSAIPPGAAKLAFKGAGVSQTRSINSRNREPLTVDVQRTTSRLTVQAVSVHGEPVADVLVVVRDPQSKWQEYALTGADGRIVVHDPPQQAKPKPRHWAKPGLHVCAFVSSASHAPVATAIATDPSAGPVILKLPSTDTEFGAVTGVIDGPDVDLLGELSVQLCYAENALQLDTGIQQAGRSFRINRVPPGTYHVFIASAASGRVFVERIEVGPNGLDVGTLQVPELGAIAVDWRFEDALGYHIKSRVWLEHGVHENVVAVGETSKTWPLFPGLYTIAIIARNGQLREERVFVYAGEEAEYVAAAEVDYQIVSWHVVWSTPKSDICHLRSISLPINGQPGFPVQSVVDDMRRAVGQQQPRILEKDLSGGFNFNTRIAESSWILATFETPNGYSEYSLIRAELPTADFPFVFRNLD